MKNLNYKGKGEHSVNELELIIEQQAEELHLLKSGEKQLPIHGVSKRLLTEVRNHYLLCTDFETGEPKADMKTLLKLWEDVNNELNI